VGRNKRKLKERFLNTNKQSESTTKIIRWPNTIKQYIIVTHHP